MLIEYYFNYLFSGEKKKIYIYIITIIIIIIRSCFKHKPGKILLHLCIFLH